MDDSRSLFGSILAATQAGESGLFMCSYLSGRSEAGDLDWVSATVNEWSHQSEFTSLAVEATVRLGGSDESLTRLLRMIDEGKASPSALTWTYYGRWLDDVSIELRFDVVKRLLGLGKEGAEAAFRITHDMVLSQSESHESVADLAYSMLEQEEDDRSSSMVAFYWAEIAKILGKQDPERIARLVLQLFLTGSPKFYDNRLELLATSLEQDPEAVWPIVGSALIQSEQAYRLAWEMERAGVVDHVPLAILRGWLDSMGKRGAEVLASVTKPKPELNDELLDLLLRMNLEVGDQLFINYWTESFTGPETHFLEEKIQKAGPWLISTSSEIRGWAEKVVRALEQRLPNARPQDEEWRT